MIELRMARLAPIQPQMSQTRAHQGETSLAFRYLSLFRRIVVGLALVAALVAFAERWTALAAAFLTIAIGEWLESSYYLTVLHWRQRRGSPGQRGAASAAGSMGARGSSQATTSSASVVTSTPMRTA